ncbi:unnamed protein product [Enterobius vermicularis]|uniref:Protein Wnt n=1 Tax=Enterobius vermicularis TaxID=51028 RepID=A0A0N4UYP2_ENTVE|nr:unnamed protein product [Enterobius vermicularis]
MKKYVTNTSRQCMWAVGCSYSEFLKHRRYKFFWLDPYDLETFRLLPQAASSVSHRSDSAACVLLPGLTQRQRNVCARHPGNIQYVIAGLTAAVRECQAQFHDQRWNCSSHKHALALPQVKSASRETAYVFALSSGAVSHAIARACAKGAVPDCGCGQKPVQSQPTKDFVWAGCSDNVRYANTFGRRFMDAVDQPHSHDARSLMNLHNSRVGRKILSNNLKKECKCHGVSGSCVTKTCWKVVPPLDRFAAILKKKYFHAAKVSAAPEGKSLVLRVEKTGRIGRYLREPRRAAARNELVFLDESPDYCKEDLANDVLGPRGRECGLKCDILCCGRGWIVIKKLVKEQCNCKFIWCCEVKCDTCIKEVVKYYCK